MIFKPFCSSRTLFSTSNDKDKNRCDWVDGQWRTWNPAPLTPISQNSPAHNLGILKSLFLEEILKFMEASSASVSRNLSQSKQNRVSRHPFLVKHTPKQMSPSSLSHPPLFHSPFPKRRFMELHEWEAKVYWRLLECIWNSLLWWFLWYNGCTQRQTAFFLWKFNWENTLYIDKNDKRRVFWEIGCYLFMQSCKTATFSSCFEVLMGKHLTEQWQ